MPGFISSFLLIALAELGDKTQLVALSFATKYKPAKVITGIFIAAAGVFLFSIFLGGLLSRFIPQDYLKIIIGISFIIFGLWTLRNDSDNDEKEVKAKFGPVMTVAVAFFLAELGDKTQLVTISLAARYHTLADFIGVWLGSTLGMVLADGLAIAIGVIAHKKLPERVIRIVSAGIFILFGVITIWQKR